MAFLNLKRREKILWVVAIVVAFGWAWKLLIVGPILEYRDKLNEEVGVKNVKLREAKRNLNLTSRSAQDALKNFISDGSTQEDMTRMIKDIEGAAAAAGLKVLETKAQPQVKNVGWFELNVSLSVEGRWSDVVHFLYQLESVDKPLLVNQMSLEASVPYQTTVRGHLEISRILAQQPSQDL